MIHYNRDNTTCMKKEGIITAPYYKLVAINIKYKLSCISNTTNMRKQDTMQAHTGI